MSRLYIAEVTASRARVSHNPANGAEPGLDLERVDHPATRRAVHDGSGGGPLLATPAFADIGTLCALADGGKVESFHSLLESLETAWRERERGKPCSSFCQSVLLSHADELLFLLARRRRDAEPSRFGLVWSSGRRRRLCFDELGERCRTRCELGTKGL